MKNRILLKEIPAGKFHSAIFTTYSINLYYLEQQVLPLLGNKSIHYVSILADSTMLSKQLEQYGLLSQTRKRNYAIHGIQSKGAFHPKMIFLASPDSVLLLLGSGNLTTSGHGKNLEVWNAIYVNSIDDEKHGFILQSWYYLKELHSDLGDSAINKLRSIEENCIILNNYDQIEPSSYNMDEFNKISFHANQPNSSIFRQISEVIGDERIEAISIMSPFYDSQGRFIQELNKRFNPDAINVLIQEDFGALPLQMKEEKNVHFYDWTDVMEEKHRQDYFHAKNIVLHGKNKNYSISGSANASIAAFGTLEIPAINQETCILYESSNTNFLKLLGINFKGQSVNLADYENEICDHNSEYESSQMPVFIKSSERNYEEVTILLISNKDIDNAVIKFHDSASQVQFERVVSLQKGNNSIQFSITNGLSLMYAELYIKAKRASNKQFITDINAFESTNPSPRNRSLNQIRKLIESGNFSTPKIIDYLNTIYKQKQNTKAISSGSKQDERKDDLPVEHESELLYLSYSEIQERVSQINDLQKPNHYVEYKGVRLWDSIFSYLKESREKEIEAQIDEEETEDLNKSSGRATKQEKKTKRPISVQNYNRIKSKVIKFLENYRSILISKTNSEKAELPSLIDLSMYLIMLEILLHLVCHKEKVEVEEKERHLLQVSFSYKDESWSDYLIQFIGMFSTWCIQKGGFKKFESVEYNLKLEHYKKMAFYTNLGSLAIFNLVDKSSDREKINQWHKVCLLKTNQVFNPNNEKHNETEDFLSFIPEDIIEEYGEANITDELLEELAFINSFKFKKSNFLEGDFLNHPEIGSAYIEKVVEGSTNTFYKLLSPGCDWDEELRDYWNGYLYSIKEDKWYKSRKE